MRPLAIGRCNVALVTGPVCRRRAHNLERDFVRHVLGEAPLAPMAPLTSAFQRTLFRQQSRPKAKRLKPYVSVACLVVRPEFYTACHRSLSPTRLPATARHTSGLLSRGQPDGWATARAEAAAAKAAARVVTKCGTFPRTFCLEHGAKWLLNVGIPNNACRSHTHYANEQTSYCRDRCFTHS